MPPKLGAIKAYSEHFGASKGRLQPKITSPTPTSLKNPGQTLCNSQEHR